MVANELFNGLNSSKCGCCETAWDQATSYGCHEKLGVFTSREQKVLQQIRDVKERARHLKRKIRNLAPAQRGSGSVGELQDQLARLKRERAQLEQERVAAAEERMRWLGHT